MRYVMYTVNKNDIESFKDNLPEYVVDNCGKKGFFMIGATDSKKNIVGMTQFFIGMLPDGECISDVIYIYVDEEYRGSGVASRMISKVHTILKKSGVEKSVVFFLKKNEIGNLFKENGYLFTKMDEGSQEFLQENHPDMRPSRTEQAICWVEH